MTFVDYLLAFACEINNKRKHRFIKAVPSEVFNELDTNKQTVNQVYYKLYKPGTIVIKSQEGRGAFSNRVFNLELEPYVIMDIRGRKYRVIRLIDLIQMRYTTVSSKAYQPYEVKAFETAGEFMRFIGSPLVKRYLIKLYGKEWYDKIIDWFKPRANAYNDLFK
jgi:hypothetical protein